jgi:hypothetical protein
MGPKSGTGFLNVRFEVRDEGLVFRVYGLRFTVYGLRFTVYGLGFRV